MTRLWTDIVQESAVEWWAIANTVYTYLEYFPLNFLLPKYFLVGGSTRRWIKIWRLGRGKCTSGNVLCFFFLIIGKHFCFSFSAILQRTLVRRQHLGLQNSSSDYKRSHKVARILTHSLNIIALLEELNSLSLDLLSYEEN